MVIGVDAVGGDHYPESPVKGAVEAVNDHSSLEVKLFGPEELVKEELNKYDYQQDRITVQDAPEIISMDESPSQAVKKKQNSSIAVGLNLHKHRQLDGFVSAGNTGALLAASTLILGKLEGVSRPTIAATYPTVKGFRLLLDAGANLEIRPEMYLQFARMATIYEEQVMDIQDPKIGLLNIGEEEEKGTDEIRAAYEILKELPNFIGNIEGKDILLGKADVFLCNGFVGNILLKFGESIPEALKLLVGSAIKNLQAKEAQQVENILSSSLSQFNYEHIGGIPFLGVNGVSMVGHGGSTPLAVKNMILSAVKCVENNINNKIVASLNN